MARTPQTRLPHMRRLSSVPKASENHVFIMRHDSLMNPKQYYTTQYDHTVIMT